MRDYLQEMSIFYREVKDGSHVDDDEHVFLVRWQKEEAPLAHGIRRYAVLGGEFHMLRLVNHWNRQFGWKFQVLPEVFQEK